MIKVKVTKNIIRRGTVLLNITLSQLIWGGISFAAAVVTFLLLKDSMNIEAVLMIAFVVSAAIAFGGIVRIQGIPFFTFVLMGLKGVDKRPFHIEGGFRNDKK